MYYVRAWVRTITHGQVFSGCDCAGTVGWPLSRSQQNESVSIRAPRQPSFMPACRQLLWPDILPYQLTRQRDIL